LVQKRVSTTYGGAPKTGDGGAPKTGDGGAQKNPLSGASPIPEPLFQDSFRKPYLKAMTTGCTEQEGFKGVFEIYKTGLKGDTERDRAIKLLNFIEANAPKLSVCDEAAKAQAALKNGTEYALRQGGPRGQENKCAQILLDAATALNSPNTPSSQELTKIIGAIKIPELLQFPRMNSELKKFEQAPSFFSAVQCVVVALEELRDKPTLEKLTQMQNPVIKLSAKRAIERLSSQQPSIQEKKKEITVLAAPPQSRNTGRKPFDPDFNWFFQE